MQFNFYPTPDAKINWQWIHALSVRPKTIELLEHKGKELHDIWVWQQFLGNDTKGIDNERKSRQIELQKILKNRVLKDMINTDERTHRMGECIYKYLHIWDEINIQNI